MWSRLLPGHVHVRRFACRAGPCGWTGPLQRRQGGWHTPQPVRPLQRWAGLGLAATLSCAALAQGLPLLLALWPDRPSVAAGISHDGEPLPAQHPLVLAARLVGGAAGPDAMPAAAVLALRQHCVWGQPGRHPYRGTVEQALTAAHLPPEVIRKIAADIRSGAVSAQLQISRTGILSTDGSRHFDAQGFAMTYGHTLCLNTRVNFAPGHSEPARLYEATDARGRHHAVMVPEVCGNVSVIGETSGRRQLALANGVPYSRDDGGGDGTRNADDPGDPPRAVPAPGTLPLVLAALAAALYFRRRR